MMAVLSTTGRGESHQKLINASQIDLSKEETICFLGSRHEVEFIRRGTKGSSKRKDECEKFPSEKEPANINHADVRYKTVLSYNRNTSFFSVTRSATLRSI